MRLATFTSNGSTRIGAVVDDAVVDLSQAEPSLPQEMVAFLAAGSDAIEVARRAADRGKHALPLDNVHLEAPVPRPGKFLITGMNYRPATNGPRPDNEVTRAGARAGNKALGEALTHMRETGHQLWCNKQVTSISGPFDPIVLPQISPEAIYENELAYVIGRRCRHLTREQAPSAIGGYMVCNDVTVVDWSQHSPTVTLGKSFDTHGPTGPWIVTADEVPDPHALELRTYVNGERLHVESTSQMIVDCFDQVAYLSQVMTLEPGDVMSTGTAALPSRFMRAGDVIRCEVEGLGHIENPVVSEEERT